MNGRRTFGFAVLTLAIAVGAAYALSSSSRQATVAPLDPAFEELVNRYLKEVRGVGGGGAANEMSAADYARSLDTRRRLLKDVQALDRSRLSFEQDIDYRFLESLLRSRILRDEQVERWKQDPREYIDTRRISYLLEADPRDPAVRAREITAALEMMPTRLANGRKNLNQHIPRWIELSNSMLDGNIVILDVQIPEFAARLGADDRPPLLAASARALAAMREFKDFVNTELPKRPVGDWKIGAELYNALHEAAYLFPENDMNLRRIARGAPDFTRVPGFHDWGWKQFKVVEKQLEIQARKIDPSRPWLKIIRDMKQEHPTVENLVFSHLEAARRTRGWTIEQDLVTIPWTDDDDIMTAAPPSYAAMQWWGFAGTVPAGSTSRKSAWTMITPSPDWDDQTIEDNLTEKDYSFMNVIAPHEVYPGHHLQRLYQNENPRKLRVYESSYSNQGWCYYIEWELGPNYGFYPADKQELYTLEMLRLKLWRMGRVIIDSGLHTGRMSYDDAVTLESETIGFVRRGGQINIDSITEGGSGTAAPTLGYFQWMLLREDYFKKMRELDQKGTLKDFHDRVYKIGFLPVTLVREALFHQLEQEFRPSSS